MNPIPGRLADALGQFLGKVEIVLAGAEAALRAGEAALAEGDAMAARTAAHRVLEQAPGSPIALALLADACDAARLDAELAMTLEELARRAPGRAEVWIRLARARAATGSSEDEVAAALARALASAEPGSDERLAALVGLADLDLARGDGARAELWLERAAATPDAAIGVRRAEASLLRGDLESARSRIEAVPVDPLDGRAALVRGRVLTAAGDPAATASLLRAYVLDVPHASEALSTALTTLPTDAQTRTRVRSVVDAKGEQQEARWRAAFARMEGANDAARKALREALDAGDAAMATPLLEAAVEDRDGPSLQAAIASLAREGAAGSADRLVEEARAIAAVLPPTPERAVSVLDASACVTHPRLVRWAADLARGVAEAWIPGEKTETTAWPALVARLQERAHEAGDAASAARVDDLAAERSRPVRLAIVGEFNAGKSTFINALIGADVAPTGVLPTTATLHHLRWAPDRFAKILFAPGVSPAERIVALGDLRAALASVPATTVLRVEMRMPLATLVDVEILDTPGYNAPDPRHADVARAAFDECDVAIWLVDAGQPMKQSERAVLEEAGRAGVPVQALVNKADRIAASDVERVLGLVADGIAGTRVESLGPPLAFSAKRALAARAAAGGADSSALTEANWPAVERLIADRIVRRSAELRESAVRRRASRVVAGLAASWKERAAKEAAASQAHADHAQRAARVAARLDRDAAGATTRLTAGLEASARAWEDDMRRVVAGRDRAAVTRDPALARYRTNRAVATMALPLARAMADLAAEAGIRPAEVEAAARAMVRAAAGVLEVGAPTASLLDAVARAAVETLGEQLDAAAVAPAPAVRADGVLRELGAFAAALERPAKAS